MSGRYNIVKKFIVKPAVKAVKTFIKGGKQKTTGKEVVNPFEAKATDFNKSKNMQVVDGIKLDTLKTKGKIKRSAQKMEEDIDSARSNLRRTTQEIAGEKVTKSGFSKGKDMKAKGGRVGLKGGSFPDLNKDGETTFADVLIGRGVIPKNKKDKKKMVSKKFKSPMTKAIKKKDKNKKRFV